MSIIKNVAVVGAAGSLGGSVLSALVASGKFNITVLIRSSSKTTFPSTIKTINVNYSSLDSLISAFRGQDAVVSTVGTSGLQGQKVIIDAALAAGVQRFLPSEFGADLANPRTAALPVFGHKVEIIKYIESVAASHPAFTYTNIRNGAFLDWGLQQSFLLDLKSGSPRVFDGGDQLFSATTLESIGQAVVGVLEHPEETRNRAVYVEDIQTSQNKLLAIVRKIAPEKKWEPIPTSLAKIEKASNEALGRGEFSGPVLYEYLFVAIMGEGTGGRMERTDNELLSIKGGKTDEDIEAFLKPLLI